MQKLIGLNFNYTYRLLDIAIRIYFDKNLNYSEVQEAIVLLD